MNSKSFQPLKTLLLLLSLLVAGCASTDKDIPELPVEEYFSTARTALDAGNYGTAVEQYETLEAKYPFGPYAQQAGLDLIYAYYKFDDPLSTIAAANRFIKLHPRHTHVDYAYYMRGLANFDQGITSISRYLPVDPSERDAGAANQSFQDFSMLVQRFPESRYAPDARKRMIYLRDNLSKNEIHAARYYHKRGAFVAAVNRADYVLHNFPGTSAVPDALTILVESYMSIGRSDLALDAYRVLLLNHPDRPEITELRKKYQFPRSSSMNTTLDSGMSIQKPDTKS